MKISKPIICERCHGEISNPNELVTATVVFQVVAYHNDCYVHDLKGPKTIVLANEPINSFSWNVTFFIMTIALVFMADFCGRVIEMACTHRLIPNWIKVSLVFSL